MKDTEINATKNNASVEMNRETVTIETPGGSVTVDRVFLRDALDLAPDDWDE